MVTGGYLLLGWETWFGTTAVEPSSPQPYDPESTKVVGLNRSSYDGGGSTEVIEPPPTGDGSTYIVEPASTPYDGADSMTAIEVWFLSVSVYQINSELISFIRVLYSI